MKLKQLERCVRRTRDFVIHDKTRFESINHLLHHARSEAFRKVPKGVKELVSVGCAGKWYFDWILETYGPVDRHTGVEFYSPKPRDLPSNVEWIANTAGNMPEIASNSADGVFSGENLEHLWPEDVIGFYLESNRILRKNGLLVVDSPNRLITTKYGWSHPEHTVELTPDEAVELTTLAGFNVTDVKGLWLCESPMNDKLYKFDDMLRFGAGSITSRLNMAEANPTHSFIWWVEARKSERAPDKENLTRRMYEIWDTAWPQRCTRTLTIVGRASDDKTEFISNGSGGVLMYGPYLPLRKGSYEISIEIELTAACDSPQHVVLDVIGGKESEVFVQECVPTSNLKIGKPHQVRLQCEMADTTFGIQTRVIVPEGVMLKCKSNPQFKSLNGNW